VPFVSDLQGSCIHVDPQPIYQSHLYAYNTLHLSLLQDLVNNNEQAILGKFLLFVLSCSPALIVFSDETSASLRIVRVLSEPPPGPISSVSALRHIFACSLLSSLVRSNEACKRAAHAILPARLFATVPPPAPSPSAHSASPANDSPAPPPVVPPPPAATLKVPEKAEDDDDPPQSLLAHLVGSLALMSRARVIAREQGSVSEMTDWDRVLVAYLCLLSVWCWDYDKGVKEILEEGGALGLVRSNSIVFLQNAYHRAGKACRASSTRGRCGHPRAGHLRVPIGSMLRVQQGNRRSWSVSLDCPLLDAMIVRDFDICPQAYALPDYPLPNWA